MAVASCLGLLPPFGATQDSGIYGTSSVKQEILGIHDLLHAPSTARRYYVKTRVRFDSLVAAPRNQNPKPKSVICGDCDGNGVVLCSQCKGRGVNSVDLFNGQFKAGDSCWLCGGKKEMLCGNCNGAGFIGGFMSTVDE
ncbi:protein BUNDLE SHEATH DEFECTIVE 2, chloroplastic isoform X1 [Hevea brasiliensis]|uniref:protein BUNDLE SHEATH DEFECTIVE 2, chloroplastic isoform X1 n=1 Tax=Hevea brasiliensis TaxID=3981 RepID=UPI0025E7F056|nr:protein BUNDLE SHEATH DEFECTIVE 2, chloroplastic isoform X1 [Hevea brasiliensis]